MKPTAKKKKRELSQSPSAVRQRERYRKRIEAGGLNRRQQINRLQYTRALLNDPTITWVQAQKKLEPADITILNQVARMTAEQKTKQAEFWANDYNAATRAWNALARRNPGTKDQIELAKAQIQLKMLFGKEILSYDQRLLINEFLAQILEKGEDFGTYWGY